MTQGYHDGSPDPSCLHATRVRELARIIDPHAAISVALADPSPMVNANLNWVLMVFGVHQWLRPTSSAMVFLPRSGGDSSG